MPYLSACWQSERLVIRDAQIADVAALRAVFNSCHYAESWEPTSILVEGGRTHAETAQALVTLEKVL